MMWSAESFDCVFVEDLRCRAIIGIHPPERIQAQTLSLDLQMHWPIAPAAASTSIHDTLDYQRVSELAVEHAREGRFLLVETLAETLAQRLMHEFGIAWLRLRVSKPDAIEAAARVGVVIERGSRPGAQDKR